MNKRPKGSFIYELIIVVLVVLLLGAILYPKKVWEKQDNLQQMCRARIKALQQYEYQYYTNYQTYTDTVSKLIQNVLNDSIALSRMDSVLQWEKMIAKDNLKDLLMQKKMPEDLKSLIMTKLEHGEPLLNLSQWDSLGYQLVSELKHYVTSPDSIRDDKLISASVNFRELLSRSHILNILEEQATSAFMRRYTVREFRRNQDLRETRYWDHYQPYFLDELKKKINLALKEDIWTQQDPEDRDSWEKVTRPKWAEQYDTLSQVKKDSIIDEQKKILWSQRKELVWKQERNKLWKKEGDQWLEENSEVWKRVLDKKWRLERKKEWVENKLASVPDSLQDSFEANKDSLWNTIVDSLKEKEYQQWLAENEDYVKEVKRDLFESDRRITWEDEAYQRWVKEKEKNVKQFWQEIKDLMWKQSKDGLWEKEKEALKQKKDALKRLYASVQWINILGEEKIVNIVNNLELPDNKELWKIIVNTKTQTNSVLYDLGIVPLFSDSLIKSVKICPVAKEKYLVSYSDTTTPPKFEIKCPIVDTTKSSKIMVINTVITDTVIIDTVSQDTITKEIMMKDTSYKKLSAPFIEKVFGGREIHNHGKADQNELSWEQQGS